MILLRCRRRRLDSSLELVSMKRGRKSGKQLTLLNYPSFAEVFTSLHVVDERIDRFLLHQIDEKKILLLLGTL